MISTKRPGRIAPRKPKPWQRIVAVVVFAAIVVLTGWMVALAPGSPAHVSKFVAGASFVLFFGAALTVPLFAARPYARIAAVTYWIPGLAFIWLGVEHWLDGHEFYTHGYSSHEVHSEAGARFQGTMFLILGVLMFAAYLWIMRLVLKQRAGRTPTS